MKRTRIQNTDFDFKNYYDTNFLSLYRRTYFKFQNHPTSPGIYKGESKKPYCIDAPQTRSIKRVQFRSSSLRGVMIVTLISRRTPQNERSLQIPFAVTRDNRETIYEKIHSSYLYFKAYT